MLWKKNFFLAVLDTETGEWLDADRPETSMSGAYRQNQYQLMRRYHHAAASFGTHMYVHGGIRDGNHENLNYIDTRIKGNYMYFCF